jgi:hypothetical protein
MPSGAMYLAVHSQIPDSRSRIPDLESWNVKSESLAGYGGYDPSLPSVLVLGNPNT